MPFNILVLSSDKSTGANFAKSLQHSKNSADDIFIIGTAGHIGRAQLTNNDLTVMVPDAVMSDPVSALKYVEQATSRKIDLLYETRSGKSMLRVSKSRASLPVFLPDSDLVDICEDKFRTFSHLSKAGLPVPATMLLNSANDVDEALRTIPGNSFWLRETMGQGGTGAFSSSDKDEIINRINERSGWGKYTLAEKLPIDSDISWKDRLSDNFFPGEMINWLALYKDDELIASQTRKRLYFEHADLTTAGVGYTGGVMSLKRDDIHDLSEKIVRSFGYKLNGAMGIDFLIDSQGQPKVTEVQPCRFYTTTFFLSQLGLNFPRLYVDTYRGQNVTPKNRINPVESGFVWLQRFGADDRACHRDDMLKLLDTGIMTNHLPRK